MTRVCLSYPVQVIAEQEKIREDMLTQRVASMKEAHAAELEKMKAAHEAALSTATQTLEEKVRAAHHA